MLLLIIHAFTFAIFVSATAMPETLNKAPIQFDRFNFSDESLVVVGQVCADHVEGRCASYILGRTGDGDYGWSRRSL